MSKKPLRLEFEYSTRSYKNHNGPCYEFTVKPVGDMKPIFPEGFKNKLNSAATLSLSSSLSLAAMQFREGVRSRVGGDTKFSEKAYFTDENGDVTEVEPAALMPY